MQTIGLAVLLYGIAFLCFFIDGLAQLVSMMCYGIEFIVTCVDTTGFFSDLSDIALLTCSFVIPIVIGPALS